MWAIVSLVSLVIVIIIANKKNINIGLVGMAVALLVGTLGGMSYKDILGGFNALLFLRMMGMQCLICVAKYNGTMEALAQRIIKIGCGRAIRLFPVILYVGLVLCEYAGTAMFLLILPVLCELAYVMKMPVQKIVGIGLLEVWAGSFAPYSLPAITLSSVAANAEISHNSWNTAIAGTIIATILFVVFYFVYGWHKETPKDVGNIEIHPLTWKHKLTLLGYVIFVLGNLFLGLDIAVVAIIIAMILCVVGVGDGKQLIKRLPWNSLFTVGGMTIMVGVVASLGGISLISQGIALISNKAIAPAVLCAVAGLMSVVSSASGVVMPTLIPVAVELTAMLPGVPIQSLVTAIGLGSYSTAVSPMSTIGANVLANYGTIYNPDDKEQKKEFNTLLLFAAIGLVVFTLAGFLGLYNIQFVS